VRGSIRENIYSAAATHRRQTLVVAVTYLELIIEEFLRAIFVAEPNRMYEYLNQSAEQKGKVDLKEVLAAESKESLLQSLALRSAKVAAQGKFKATMRNIRQITGQGIHPTLVEKLDGLITRRNELVHETHDLEVDWREASDALSAVWDLARWLGAIAETAGVAAPAPEFGPDVWEDDAEQGDADGPRRLLKNPCFGQ
jgi:transcriptional regulator with PAS, ATPase and Fis domain